MNTKIIWIIVGLLVLIGIWLGSGIFIYSCFAQNERGIIGDMFGAINALFSGMALFGIIISIIIQQNELNLQRKELIDTREEFKINRLTNILFKQIEYLNKRILEITFSDSDKDEMLNNKGTIDKFINLLEEYSDADLIENDKNEIIRSIIQFNLSNVTQMIDTVNSSFSSFNSLLIDSRLKESEIIQMKTMLKENVSSYFYSLLRFVQNYSLSLLSIEKERIKYILEYNQ